MKKNSVNTQTEALRLADEAAAELQEQQVLVAERLMDCDHCGGTGVDGDVDDRGRTIDVQCRSCAGSGKTAQQEHVEHTSVRRSGPHM